MTADDFVLLTGSCAVSPKLKVSVTLGRFDLEINGVQIVDVWHDPLLTADRLFMPETESPFYITPSEPREPRQIPFFSQQRRSLFSFGFAPRSEGSSLIFSAAAYDDEMAHSMARFLSNNMDGELRARPFEVLRMIVRAIGSLTDWPLDVGFHGSWNRIDVRLGLSFLTAIRETPREALHLPFPSEETISVLDLPG
jgi:hypothetical protein